MSDQLWIEKLRNGDHSAFENIFKTYHKDLVRYSTNFIGDINAAEDIVEDCFYWLWDVKESINIKNSLRSFLFSVVTNKCLNYMKKNNHQKQYEEYIRSITIRKEINYPEVNLISKELSVTIQEAIDNLPEQCRKIFLLSRNDDKKYEEIATMLDISINTVKKQMNRAISKLKDALKDYL